MLLYKYFPPTTNSFKSLINAGVWCDNYSNMNDPFECLANVSRLYDENQIKDFKSKALKSIEPRWRLMAELRDEVIVEFIKNFRQEFIKNSYYFGSLSENNDDILLWSHYAASHTGFVLAINFDETDNHIQKVAYQDTLPDYDNEWYFKLKDEDEENSASVSYLLKDFAIKSTNWSYEKEWKVSRKNRGYFRFKPEDVKAIYFGLNCNADIEKVFVTLLSYTDDDVPVYKMALSTNPFMIIAKDYEFPEK